MTIVTQTGLLNHRMFFVRERVGAFKLTDTFDLIDPTTRAPIGIAAENIGTLAKLARLVIKKQLMPMTIEVREGDGGPVIMSLYRGWTFLRAEVAVRDATGHVVGRFRSKLMSIGGAFTVLDATDRQIAEVSGDWKGWNFRVAASDGSLLGTVTKQWAGIGKEFFTSADNYVIALDERTNLTTQSTMLLLAAGLAIDTVYKEH